MPRIRRLHAGIGVAALVAGLLVGPMTGMALATPLSFDVNTAGNAADLTIDGNCDSSATAGSQCTLRAALQEANANPGTDTITFSGLPSPYRIVLSASGLPGITDPVIIDGTSLTGFSPSTGVIPRVDATSTTTGVQYDFDLQAGSAGTTIKGLELVGANTAEVHITSNGNAISGDYIGTTAANATTCTGGGNCGQVTGVRIEDASNNIIGGTTTAARNVISNNSWGVQVTTVAGSSSGNVIEGNYVGTKVAGTAALPNGEGIVVNDENGAGPGPDGTVVGGTAAGAGNVISGNSDTGLWLSSGQNAVVQGNIVGLTAAGTAKLGNAYGVYMDNQAGTTKIGGATAAERNVISGNNSYGVDLSAPPGPVTIAGNYVGTGLTGSTDLGNGYEGVYAYGSNGLLVDNNVIAGNDDVGSSSQLQVDSGDHDTLSNNLISLAANGTTALPGPGSGIYLSGDTDLSLSHNVASSNAGDGIEMYGTTGATIIDNRAGTDVSGTLARANGQSGFYTLGSTELTIGTPGHGNQFSGNNNGYGINANQLTDSTIQANLIGTNPTGTGTLVNGGAGIYLVSGVNDQIGGTASGAGNLISGTTSGCCNAGLYLDSTHYTTVLGNLIGIGAGGQNLGNGYDGVDLGSGSDHNVIGSATNTAGANVIANSGNDGICNNGQRNTIVGNSIFSNGALGIDNNCDDTVDPNDTGDADTGPNQMQNYPVLGHSLSSASGTQVTGTLNSRPNKTYQLDFYTSPTCDGSTFGEGKTYLGSKSVTTDGSGNVSFTAQVTGAAAGGSRITATATDPLGDTSEFSKCITNSSTLPTISVANASAGEAAGNLVFTVSLDSAPDPSGAPVTVQYATSDGTATSPADYTASSGTVTFNAGDTTKNVSVPIVNDTLDENNETFTLTLSNPNNALIGAGQGSATGTIVDNDAPPTVSVINLGAVTEGNSGTTPQSFRIKLSTASSLPVSVVAATVGAGATADVDYQSNAANISFAPGETTKNFTVQVLGDTIHELNEFYSVNLFNPSNATLGTSHIGGQITDDDPVPQVTVGDTSISEGNSGTTMVNVPISLNTVSGLAVKVQLMTVDSTATSPSDYIARGVSAPAYVTIPAGQTSGNFPVTIKGDTAVEPDETFTVQTVGTPTNGAVADGSGTVTIVNDD